MQTACVGMLLGSRPIYSVLINLFKRWMLQLSPTVTYSHAPSRPPTSRQVPGPTFAYIKALMEASGNKKLAAVQMASGESSRGKGFGLGEEKGLGKDHR